MKLISRIALRLSLALLPLMALWGVLFYFTMVDEINDEADDALEDYSELIVKRMLAGRELPKPNNGRTTAIRSCPSALPKPPSVRISITTTPRSTFPKRRRPSRPAY